jgi:outer membrane protein assembly factor BamB
MKTIVKFLLVTCLLSLVSAVSFPASWPLFRAGEGRTGQTAEVASPKLTPLWNFQIQGGFVSSPVIYKGIVYCGGGDGSVWAWDAGTGEQIWQYSTSGSVNATPCVSSATVYVPGKDRNVYAFDRLTGTLRWQTYTGSQDCSSPVYYEGKLYFLSGFPEKKLFCLSADNGQILTAAPISQFSFSSPAVRDHLLYFGTNDGKFHCIDLRNSQELWSRHTAGSVFYSSLAAGKDAVYAVSGGDERRLFCLDPLTGNVLWRSAELDHNVALVSSVCLDDNNAYVVCSKTTELDPGTYSTALMLYAFPLAASSMEVEPLWSKAVGMPHPSEIISSPVVASGVIFVGSGDGRLYCIDTASRKYIEPGSGNLTDAATGYYLCYTVSTSTGIVSSPAIANGRVYIGTCDGNFWAFEAAKRAFIAEPDNGDTVSGQMKITGGLDGFASNNYTLALGAGTAPLSWTEITASTAGLTTTALGTLNASALNDGTYTLRLTVSDAPALRAENQVTVDNPPAAPATLTVRDTPFDAGGSLTLDWKCSFDDGNGDNDVQGYRIYKSTWPGGFSVLTQTAAGITTFTDSACPPQTTYYYAVTAFDRNAESPASDNEGAFSIVDGQEITPENGGTITLEKNGLLTEIVVEPGSVASPVRMGILIPGSYPDDGVPASAAATGIVREFGVAPAETKFLKPVTIKIPYGAQDIDGISRENLRIYWRDETKGEWRIVNTSDPLSEEGRVQATIPHFSLYRLMAYKAGEEDLLSRDKVYTYPNPAKGDTLYFKYYLGNKADVALDVYNVAGERIAHLEKANNPAGIVSEIEWKISSIASGVYVYRLEARAAGKSKAVKKKLAIIH